MTASTEAPKPQFIHVKIAEKQHNALANLLNQHASLAGQIVLMTQTLAAGSAKEVPPTARLVRTEASNPKIGPRKFFVVFQA